MHGTPSVLLSVCASLDVLGHRDLRGSAWTVASPRGRGLPPPSVCYRDVAGDDLVLLSGLFEISSNIPFFFLSTSF